MFTDNKALQHITTQIEHLEPQHTSLAPNLSNKHQEASSKLENDDTIIIKKADKSNIFIIMDATFYKKKLVLKDHLLKPIYEASPESSDKNFFKNLQKLATTHKECLTSNEFKYVTEYEWKSSNFYVQPKINKCAELKELISNSNANYIKNKSSRNGRPIIAGQCSPTKHLSQLIDKIISPLVPLQISYIKDDWDFIKKLQRTQNYDGELFT